MLRDILGKRRSVRQFQQKLVEPEKIDQLIEIALRAPSSMSRNPWQFIVVTDRAKIEALSQAKAHGASFMKNAPLVIVVTADPEKCDVWIEDCSIATFLLHLGAEDLGLGSCWVQVRKRQDSAGRCSECRVAEIVGLPGNMHVLAMVAIGYGAEKKTGHPTESLPFAQVHFESYGQSEKTS